ncbi:MAG: hypothetical protein HRF43_15775 [Phycisphaerae bacterium]|jgi:lysophospholipase L1-like esterase
MYKGSIASAACLLGLGLAARADDFAIRDADTVVFLGDSITAARAYGQVIENYTLLRYPGRNVRFHNAGWGGDTAAGGLKRLERDVFARGATLLTVAYGVNDIGWVLKADDEHRQLYLDSIRGIVEACKKKGVRVFICSAAITAGDKGEDDYLQKMCNEGMAIARAAGEGAIDVMGSMREIQKRVRQWTAAHKDAKDTLHAADGVHLSDLGQLAMAYAILKGLGAPADVSSATLSARDAGAVEAKGCRISDVRVSDDGRRIAFTRLDEGLPLNLEPLWQLQFRFIPFPDQLNRYLLAVKDLPAGRYEITADGRAVGTFDAGQLSAGVNLSSATADPWQPGGPWDAQAHLLKRLTEARNHVAVNAMWAPRYLEGTSNLAGVTADLAELDAAIVRAQRNVARPVAYRFEVRPADPPPGPEAK